MAKEKKDESFMVKLATLIVDKRKGFAYGKANCWNFI